MSATRFYDRQTDMDGPVIGSLQVLYVPMPSITGAQTPEFRVSMPAGMKFNVTDAYFTAAATGATPTVQIGDTSDATAVVAAVTCTTNLGALTIKDGLIPAGDELIVTITSTASDTITEGNLTIVGHIASPPNSIGRRPGYPGAY